MIKVWDGDNEVRGRLVFSGLLDLRSGVLKASDALGTSIRVPLEIGSTTLQIYTDAAVDATQVDLVVTRKR